MEKVKFKSAEDMLRQIEYGTDYYNVNTGEYVFVYNDCDSICTYTFGINKANELARKTKESGDYWGAYLGTGGNIIDSPEYYNRAKSLRTPDLNYYPINFCESVYSDDGWYVADENFKFEEESK